MNRGKPFSGKQKKQQLKEKRTKKRQQTEEEHDNKPNSHFIIGSEDSLGNGV